MTILRSQRSQKNALWQTKNVKIISVAKSQTLPKLYKNVYSFIYTAQKKKCRRLFRYHYLSWGSLKQFIPCTLTSKRSCNNWYQILCFCTSSPHNSNGRNPMEICAFSNAKNAVIWRKRLLFRNKKRTFSPSGHTWSSIATTEMLLIILTIPRQIPFICIDKIDWKIDEASDVWAL